MSLLIVFRLSCISEEGTVGWRATKHKKIQLTSQQALLSPYNLQLITSFVFIQRTVCDLFAQMHEHSNAELAHSLMLEEVLYPFDISSSPITERFTIAEGFYSQGEYISFLVFCTLFLINTQWKLSLYLLRSKVSLAIKVKADEVSKQMNSTYNSWTIKPKLYEFCVFRHNTNIAILPYCLVLFVTIPVRHGCKPPQAWFCACMCVLLSINANKCKWMCKSKTQ